MQGNVPPLRRVFTPNQPFSKFPGMRWHPETGEVKLCAAEADMPAGWLDCHPASLAADPLPMTREEIVSALSEGGVSFKKKAATDVLYALLLENLKAALTEMGIAFSDVADAKALMDLFPKE